MPNIYCLLLPQETRKIITQERTALFRLTGSASYRTFPPCILLGETDRRTIGSTVPCPPLPLRTEDEARFESGILHLPLRGEPLSAIRDRLGVTYPVSGIFLGNTEENRSILLPPIGDLRIGLMEYEVAGPLTRWRILEDKHLRTDRI